MLNFFGLGIASAVRGSVALATKSCWTQVLSVDEVANARWSAL
jgi:hypothetical protein